MKLEVFSRKMKVTADRIPKKVDLIVRTVALAVDKTVVLATPVDTGRARSNWLVSLGSPSLITRGPYNPLPKGRDPSKLDERGNANAAIEQGRAQIARRRSGQSIFITNSLDYIGLLNHGSSVQAPELFVQLAVKAGIRTIRGIKIKIVGKR